MGEYKPNQYWIRKCLEDHTNCDSDEYKKCFTIYSSLMCCVILPFLVISLIVFTILFFTNVGYEIIPPIEINTTYSNVSIYNHTRCSFDSCRYSCNDCGTCENLYTVVYSFNYFDNCFQNFITCPETNSTCMNIIENINVGVNVSIWYCLNNPEQIFETYPECIISGTSHIVFLSCLSCSAILIILIILSILCLCMCGFSLC